MFFFDLCCLVAVVLPVTAREIDRLRGAIGHAETVEVERIFHPDHIVDGGLVGNAQVVNTEVELLRGCPVHRHALHTCSGTTMIEPFFD